MEIIGMVVLFVDLIERVIVWERRKKEKEPAL